MTRHGTAIQDRRITDSVKHGIQASQKFWEWEAAIAAGATLDELEKWERIGGGYSPIFKAMVFVWYERHRLLESHIEDAKAKAIKAKSK